jgi:hypothetical protein
VAAALPAPHDEASRRAAAGRLAAVYERKPVAPDYVTADAVDGVLLVAGWFRRHPQERDRCLTYANALAACSIA